MIRDVFERAVLAAAIALAFAGTAAATPVSKDTRLHRHERHASDNRDATRTGTPGGLIGALIYGHGLGGYYGNGPYGGYMGW